MNIAQRTAARAPGPGAAPISRGSNFVRPARVRAALGNSDRSRQVIDQPCQHPLCQRLTRIDSMRDVDVPRQALFRTNAGGRRAIYVARMGAESLSPTDHHARRLAAT